MSGLSYPEAVLPVEPFRKPPCHTAEVPGSKSISNRALLLASLCSGTIRIENLLDSDDTRALCEAFFYLGIKTGTTEGNLLVSGCEGAPPKSEATFNVRNAGTVARFLPAALSVCQSGFYSFDGSPAMRKRPMAGLIDSLCDLGAEITCQHHPGHFPFVLRPHGWRKESLWVDASRSSQILSGLLIAATAAPHPMRFQLTGDTVSKPFVQMTLRMIRDFGGNANETADGFTVQPGLHGPQGHTYRVEPDATAASYFFALPIATGGSMTVNGFPGHSLQGDLRFLEVLEKAGLQILSADEAFTTKAPPLLPSRDPRLFLDVDFNAFSDTFLTLAALAPLLPGPIRIRGIGHTRHQETDRIAAMATELRKLGQQVADESDEITIYPHLEAARSLSAEKPVEIDTYEDHRVAMSFGILGCHDLHGDGRPWISIRNPGCSGKTFPKFFEELARIRTIAESSQNA